MPTSKPASPMLGSILCDDLRHFKAGTWWRVNREKAWALAACLLYLFSLMQPVSEPTTEPLSYEQLEAVALDRTRAIVACAQGRSISVGDMLIKCDPFAAPTME